MSSASSLHFQKSLWLECHKNNPAYQIKPILILIFLKAQFNINKNQYSEIDTRRKRFFVN